MSELLENIVDIADVARVSGDKNLDYTFKPGIANSGFVLIFARMHFRDGLGSSIGDFTIHLDAIGGEEYDVHLESLSNRGQDADINLIFETNDGRQPSPWSFQAGDGVRFRWTNAQPGVLKWGLEVGYKIASQR